MHEFIFHHKISQIYFFWNFGWLRLVDYLILDILVAYFIWIYSKTSLKIETKLKFWRYFEHLRVFH